jgi:hypothetical protein
MDLAGQTSSPLAVFDAAEGPSCNPIDGAGPLRERLTFQRRGETGTGTALAAMRGGATISYGINRHGLKFRWLAEEQSKIGFYGSCPDTPEENARLCEGKMFLNFKGRRLRPRHASLRRPALPQQVQIRALAPRRPGTVAQDRPRLFVNGRTNPCRLMFDKRSAAGYSHARLLQGRRNAPCRSSRLKLPTLPATQPEPASSLTGWRSTCD